jgi:hypothetical protein
MSVWSQRGDGQAMNVQALIQKPLNFCSYEEARELTNHSWGPRHSWLFFFCCVFLFIFLGTPDSSRRILILGPGIIPYHCWIAPWLLQASLTRLGQLHPPHVSHCQYFTMAFHGLSLKICYIYLH